MVSAKAAGFVNDVVLRHQLTQSGTNSSEERGLYFLLKVPAQNPQGKSLFKRHNSKPVFTPIIRTMALK